MFKSFRQLKSFLHALRENHMNRELKNLKISPEVHKKLKLQAAEHGISISDYADILLTLSMSEIDIWRDGRHKMLAELAAKR